jgi:hypothetical protein
VARIAALPVPRCGRLPGGKRAVFIPDQDIAAVHQEVGRDVDARVEHDGIEGGF